MLISQYDWFFANVEFIFLILVIFFDRDDSFISDFSARSKHFFFAINFREESRYSFFFYSFFHRQQSIFQHFHCFSQIIADDRKLSDVRRNLNYFLRESKDFREHFLLKLRKLSVDTNQFEKQKRDQSRRIVSMKRKKEETTKIERICRLLRSTKEKSKRFKASNIIEFENSTTEFSKTSEEVLEIKKTILIIFFIEIIIFFLNWLFVFFFLRLVLSKLRQKFI